jgi:hypothetical protein
LDAGGERVRLVQARHHNGYVKGLRHQ